MRLTASPKNLQSVFAPMRAGLTKPQFLHLRCFVLAVLVRGRSEMRAVAQASTFGRHRTSVGLFLCHAEWDEASLLAQESRRVLQSMQPRKGEVVYLLLDDTRIVKRARKMDDVSKLWDHTHQRFASGHTVVVAAVHFRGVTLPWRLEVWQAKSWAGARYRKPTEIAAALIHEFQPPPGIKVRVLFDAYYLCAQVTNACQTRGFTWFSVASKNRTLTRGCGGKRTLKQLGPGLLKYAGQRVRLRRHPGWRWMRIAATDGRLAKIGAVRIVFSKRPRDPWKKLLAVATNEVTRSAREIIAIYEKRWHIEVLFKELRSELGLGAYRMQKRKGIRRHLHLICLAHLVLTRHSLRTVGAQARKANAEIPLPPFRERIAILRQDIQRDQIVTFIRRIKHERIRQRVREYLLAS
jgi:DDE family transposase